jgi:hypothetical protein
VRRLIVVRWFGVWTMLASTTYAMPQRVEQGSAVILTVDGLEKLARTQNAIDRARSGPVVGHVDARLDEDLANAAARLDLDPEVRAILDRVGWSAIDYLSVGAELLKTLLVMQDLASGQTASAPNPVLDANVRVISDISSDSAPEFAAWKQKYVDPLLAEARRNARER